MPGLPGAQITSPTFALGGQFPHQRVFATAAADHENLSQKPLFSLIKSLETKELARRT